LLGWTTVCAVELDDYCQRVLKQRQEDGHLPRFPIHGDVKAFDGDEWSGRVDVITAGFPCQPFSIAGKQRGEADERNLWPETIRVIREVGPRFAFLENVPGLLAHPYFGTILGELSEAGFDAEWLVLGADDCGAPHRRKRLWILAHARSERAERITGSMDKEKGRETKAGNRFALPSIHRGPDAPHAQRPELRHEPRRRSGSSGTDQAEPRHDGAAEPVADTTSEQVGVTRQPRQGSRRVEKRWWQSEPNVGRVADGVASRMDRLRAIGNGQVPIVAATAFLELRRRLEL